MTQQAVSAQIARKLGVTEAGLSVLAKLAAGRYAWGGVAGQKLVEQGYVQLIATPGPSRRHVGVRDPQGRHGSEPFVTDAGREIVRQARAMGW